MTTRIFHYRPRTFSSARIGPVHKVLDDQEAGFTVNPYHLTYNHKIQMTQTVHIGRRDTEETEEINIGEYKKRFERERQRK